MCFLTTHTSPVGDCQGSKTPLESWTWRRLSTSESSIRFSPLHVTPSIWGNRQWSWNTSTSLICTVARRRVHEEDVTMGGCATPACSKAGAPDTGHGSPGGGNFRGLARRTRQGACGSFPPSPLESKTPISPGRRPIPSFSAQRMHLGTDPGPHGNRSGLCQHECRLLLQLEEGGTPHVLLRTWTPRDIKEGAESRSSPPSSPLPCQCSPMWPK